MRNAGRSDELIAGYKAVPLTKMIVRTTITAIETRGDHLQEIRIQYW
jgi:hypothetical protein